MGLDQYLYAKKYTSDSAIFNKKEMFNQLKETIGTDVAFLTRNLPSISVEIMGFVFLLSLARSNLRARVAVEVTSNSY